MAWWSKRTKKPASFGDGLLDLVTDAEIAPLLQENGEVRALLAEWLERRETTQRSWYNPEVETLVAFSPMKSADRERQAAHVNCLAHWLRALDKESLIYRKDPKSANGRVHGGWEAVIGAAMLLKMALNHLLKRKLTLADSSLRTMLLWQGELVESRLCSLDGVFCGKLVALIKYHTEETGMSAVLRESLEHVASVLRSNELNNDGRKFSENIEALLGRAPELPIVPGGAWADAAIEDLSGIEASDRARWTALLQHCKTAPGGSPSGKWLKQAEKLLSLLEPVQAGRFISRWFSLTDRKREEPLVSKREWILRCARQVYSLKSYEFLQTLRASGRGLEELKTIEAALQNAEDPWDYLRNFHNQPDVRHLFGNAPPEFRLATTPPSYAPVENQLIISAHMELLTGLAWVAGLLKDDAVTRALGVMAVSMYRKVPGIGPRAVRVGNACIVALGMIGDTDALGQLALLKVKVKFGGAQAAIDKAMTKLADKLGISREDLEEMSVPAYGMTGVGRLEQAIGDYTAELSVIDSRSTALVWVKSDGKLQKSMPASLKQEHAEDVKELLAAKKDIERMLPAVAERLDALYLRRKSWPLEIWRERHLDHPLVGALARRLIWNFTSGGTTTPGVWLKDSLVDRLGQPLALDEKETTVALWHPLHQETTVVLGWRGFLEEWEIVQPFKQAHREIYLLTPPEETTRTYSNRFAAHLLKQHQFNALCAARGWKNKLRLMVDDEYPPATRRLPQWGLRAEFWIEGAGTDYGTDTLESGAYRYVTTDQVRFYQENDPQVSAHAGGGGYGPGYHQRQAVDPIPLADVDPLVFSEIMRDVDLFAGVASVGNDPNWLDGGHTAQQRHYWGEVSFGELGASAQTRKALLERLIPKLKIAAACSFEDRFLIVQGKRHAYKIHLGSGNILIQPHDKYLCIVPAQSQVDKDGGKLFLPFEGDRTLSVIISKAFLLAADDKISDATILRQLV